jgi:hypothetical protein
MKNNHDRQKVAQARLGVSRGIQANEKGIDREYEDSQFKGMIKGVAVMSKGNVKDVRGWEIDDTTLEQVIAAGNKPKLGLKSRFGHPNMSSTALGTYLGRIRNLRLDGAVVRGDLYLSKTAYTAPAGDLASYVLDLADNDPAAFGTSVVLGDYDLEARVEKDGTRKKDSTGNYLPPLLRVKSLFAVDVVDDPAANNGFFSKDVGFSAEMTEFLDTFLSNPANVEFAKAFLDRYSAETQDQINDKTKREDKMGIEMKDLTAEMLQKERPDLVDQIKKGELSKGHEAGVKEERERCGKIVEQANKEFAGKADVSEIVLSSIKNGSSFDAANGAMLKKQLDAVTAGKPNPGADQDTSGECGKSHLDRARKYAVDHKCSMVDALKATAE